MNLDGSKSDIQERLLSHGARISRNQPGRHSILRNHSSIGNYHDYEREFSYELPSQDGHLLGEHERLDAFIRELWDQELQLIYLASDPLNRDSRPAESIAAFVDEIARRRAIAGVVIDYVGRAVKDNGEQEPTSLSRDIHRFVTDSRHLIASRWQCPVWLVHQLNASVNRTPPGTVQRHVDAAGCRSFGDELDACLVLGARDDQSNAVLLDCTKAPTEPPAPTILRFHSHFATFVPADELHIDRVTSRLVPRRQPIDFDPSFDDSERDRG